ncbi:Solute carrier family 25 member 35 [Amphibalanus amphitrite]|uniref:Solute carrier family 25 member 35 n=1 Tax=Amphibalanus amphitrite TaxID=1232801 RepID=A0A6A4VUI5_AMPAM|nr:Solute carrier family 25 member 35 [Amphibalanus amphitrite]
MCSMLPYAIARADGILALQKGLSPALCYQMMMNGVRLGTFHILEDSGIMRTNDAVSPWKYVCGGAFAGALGSYFGSPFYLVKTHLQTQSATIGVGHQHRHGGLAAALRAIYGPTRRARPVARQRVGPAARHGRLGHPAHHLLRIPRGHRASKGAAAGELPLHAGGQHALRRRRRRHDDALRRHRHAALQPRRGQQRPRSAVPRLRRLRAQDPALGGTARLLQGRDGQLAARRTALGAQHELLVVPEGRPGRGPCRGRGGGGGRLVPGMGAAVLSAVSAVQIGGERFSRMLSMNFMEILYCCSGTARQMR